MEKSEKVSAVMSCKRGNEHSQTKENWQTKEQQEGRRGVTPFSSEGLGRRRVKTGPILWEWKTSKVSKTGRRG